MKTAFLPAALLVIAAALAGCEKEPVVSGPPESGKPFIVHVVNPGETRGSELTTVSAFNMAGVQGGSTLWMDNYLFTNPGSGWTAAGHEDLCWPGGAGTHTFYATCDNTDAAPAVTGGRFVYTVPSDVSDQKDLLVALAEDQVDGTPVSLQFKHALSSVKFKIGHDASEELYGEKDLRIHVTRITLYHIATKGTFDFAGYATGPWTVDPGDAEYRDIVINLTTPVDFTPSDVSSFISLDERIDGEIYVLPHKPTPWDTDGTPGHPLNNSYIGITCQIVEYRTTTFYDYYGLDEDSDEDDYEDAKELYIDDGGFASTDNDDWLNDKEVSVVVPTKWSMDVYLESILDHRNAVAAANGTEENVEEVFIPLEMANGFGFNKTNVINIRMDRMKNSDGQSFYSLFVPFDP
ncbi:MAG: fimbrillin family protein [Bacteroidales bacterium]|nr:fimbrillin family protein [Bacteroidales bacterium]